MRKQEVVGAVEKALKILECFSPETPELGVTEISKRLGLPKPTANRLLSTLETNGYLEKDTLTKKYRTGKKLLTLAAIFLNQLDIRRVALPVMTRIRDLTKETVSLNLLDDTEKLLLDYVIGTYELVHLPKVGRRTPLYVGASSKAILAFLEKDKIEEIIFAQPLEPLTEKTVTNPLKLEKELEKIRAQGYAVTCGEREKNILGIAAPIQNHIGYVIGSLSIGIPTIRVKEKDLDLLARLIKEGAEEISEELGKRSKQDFARVRRAT